VTDKGAFSRIRELCGYGSQSKMHASLSSPSFSLPLSLSLTHTRFQELWVGFEVSGKKQRCARRIPHMWSQSLEKERWRETVRLRMYERERERERDAHAG